MTFLDMPLRRFSVCGCEYGAGREITAKPVA